MQAMAVVISNGAPGAERMEVARPGAVFKELTGAIEYTVTVGDDGWADFPVEGKAVAVWVQQ
jgi:alpha-amylase